MTLWGLNGWSNHCRPASCSVSPNFNEPRLHKTSWRAVPSLKHDQRALIANNSVIDWGTLHHTLHGGNLYREKIKNDLNHQSLSTSFEVKRTSQSIPINPIHLFPSASPHRPPSIISQAISLYQIISPSIPIPSHLPRPYHRPLSHPYSSHSNPSLLFLLAPVHHLAPLLPNVP